MKTLAFQLLIFLILFSGCWFALKQINWLALFKVEILNKETEKTLGDLLYTRIRKSKTEINDERILLPLDSLLSKICNSNGIDRNKIKLHIINNRDEINAFALPDKRIVIFTGLLLECKNEAELSGVIAHELAHLESNHLTKKFIKEVGLSALSSIASGNIEILKHLSKTLSSTAYDRTLEREADLKAADYLAKSEISSKFLADFLSRISDLDTKKSNLLSWVSTHPYSTERAEYLIKHDASKIKSTPILSKRTWLLIKATAKDI